MEVGFRVTSSDGSEVVQIDGTYQNLHLRGKGTIATSAGQSLDIRQGGVRGQYPLFALSSPQHVWASRSIPEGNGVWRVRMVARGSGSFNVDWYCFDIVAPDEVPNFGLVIRNEAGEIVFDALRKPMRVVGMVDHAIPDGGGQPVSGLFDASRKYAVVQSGVGSRVNTLVSDPKAGKSMLYSAYRASNGKVQAVSYGSGGLSKDSQAFYRITQGMVIDVTNF